MPRTPILKRLIHEHGEVEENGRFFDILVELMPVEVDAELRQIIASTLLENIRQTVDKEGFFKLPFNLIVKRD